MTLLLIVLLVLLVAGVPAGWHYGAPNGGVGIVGLVLVVLIILLLLGRL